MTWALAGSAAFILIIAVLAYFYIRDRQIEKKSVVETMSPKLWDEIAHEREENLLKAKKFREALKKAAQAG